MGACAKIQDILLYIHHEGKVSYRETLYEKRTFSPGRPSESKTTAYNLVSLIVQRTLKRYVRIFR